MNEMENERSVDKQKDDYLNRKLNLLKKLECVEIELRWLKAQ